MRSPSWLILPLIGPALDGTRRRSPVPSICAVLPRRLRLGLPHADAAAPRFRLALDLVTAVTDEGPGEAGVHKRAGEIDAVG